MNEQPQDIVRKSVRHDVWMRASISILPAQAELIRFAAGSGAREGWVDVDLVDFSSTGIGMISTVFVPRRALLLVRAFGIKANSPMVVEAPVRVQRVCMTDRRPAYLIGTSFAELSADHTSQIDKLLELLASNPAPAGVTGGAS